jgi:5-(carboxyamino)imidazole ribonucleotide synthase
VFYPLTLNLHVDGILMASLSPLHRLQGLQAEAEAMLGALLNHLDYVGVMAMECFRVGEHLMINELAPRVHNSGHWTQAGAHISQFELHLRAIADLPLTPMVVQGSTAMVNLVGTERNDQWLTVPPIQLHWYGKTVRAGRKVGHININHRELGVIRSALVALEDKLPATYGPVLEWLRQHLGQ